MLYYTAREMYHAVKRKYTGCYILGMLILCILANIAMACFRSIYGMNDGSSASNLIIFAEGVFVIPYYSCIFMSDIVFGTAYPNPHIKDRATKNLHRWQLYLGKFLATLGLGALLYIVSFIMLVGITALFGMADHSIDVFTITDFLEKSLVALPLWIAGISMGQMFLFVFEDKRKAFVGFYILVLFIPRLIMLLAFESINIQPFPAISNILITPQFQALQFYYTMDPPKCWTLGIIYTIISLALGITFFYKKKNFK